MIEKPEESQVIKENCISMVQCRVMKQLEFLEQRKFEAILFTFKQMLRLDVNSLFLEI